MFEMAPGSCVNAKFERWMYPRGRPNRVARLLNRGWAIAHAAGLWPARLVTLEVAGRRTGRRILVPLVVADYAGERYLVSMLGQDSNWVRNVRAAGGRAVLRHGRREHVRLEEVASGVRAPILRRYLSLAPGPRAFIQLDPDAPLEEFEEVAPRIPVFRITTEPSPTNQAALERPRRRWVRRVFAVIGVLVAVLVIAALFVAYAWAPPEERSYGSQYLARIADRNVQTPIARFHYLKIGSGPPLVLIPGGLLWFYSYRKIIPVLAQHSTVYAVDMPGQGYTRVLKRQFGYDLEAQSEALGSFMQAVGLTRAAVVGHSWGGAIALYFAERNPARVTRLALLDTPTLTDDSTLTFRLLEFPVIGELIGKLLSRSTYESGLRDTFVHEQRLTERDVDEYWAPMSFRENRKAMWLQQRRFDYAETRDALRGVRAPTLVLWGARDQLDAPWQAKALARRIPTASVRLFSGCGHTIQEDCPARTASALEQFMFDDARR